MKALKLFLRNVCRPAALAVSGLALLGGNSMGEQLGTVNFNNLWSGSSINAPVTDAGSTRLAGTNYWAQLYAADGLSAAESDLLPVGIPVNFRTGTGAGYVQNHGSNALGEAISSIVNATQYPPGPGSVQLRAWCGPFPSYAVAQSNGAQYGESRVLRINSTGGDAHNGNPPTPPVNLVDASGPINGFALRGLPVFAVDDVVVAEGTNDIVEAVFSVTLFPATNRTVSVAYATVDGTALAGSDYVSTSGVLIFQPGQTRTNVSVTVTGDFPPEPDETFFLALSGAVNAPIARGLGTCTITEIHIKEISVDTVVTFNTVLGHAYVLESTDILHTTPWAIVPGTTNIIGTGGNVSISDKGAGCTGSRIYRARLIE